MVQEHVLRHTLPAGSDFKDALWGGLKEAVDTTTVRNVCET